MMKSKRHKNRLDERHVLFEDVFDVSVVLLQSAFPMTSLFTDASCHKTFDYVTLEIKSPRNTGCIVN